jgi:hypothetical protein
MQVALRGTEMVKPVQKDLNAIAERVQASNRQWYKFILTGRTANPKIIAPGIVLFVCVFML